MPRQGHCEKGAKVLSWTSSLTNRQLHEPTDRNLAKYQGEIEGGTLVAVFRPLCACQIGLWGKEM